MIFKNLDDIEEIIGSVKANGLAIFPDFMSSEELANVISDYNLALDKKEFQFSEGENTASKIFWNDLDKFEFIKKAFNKSEFKKISNEILGSGNIDFCHTFYLMNDQIGTRNNAHDLHFDVIPQLKFYFYLNDVTKENGAFEYVPKSHLWTKELRKKNNDKITFENREFSRNLTSEYGDSIPLEAKAGTMVIFDTDMFHKAGTVTKGNRMVLRGHTRIKSSTPILKKIKDKILSFFLRYNT